MLLCKLYTDLRNELHVTVLNAVVHHLDVVASTLVTNPLTAWLAVRLGGDALEDVLDVWPGLLVTTRHDGWTVAGTLLTTRDTGADEADALLGKVLGAAVGVWEVGVAAIDDDVARLDTALGEQSLDEVVDGLAGHDEQHHATWLLELLDELPDAMCANNALALGLVVQEAVNLGDGTVEGDDGEAVVGGVEDQVLAHDGQTDETEVSAVRKSLLATTVREVIWQTLSFAVRLRSMAAALAMAMATAGICRALWPWYSSAAWSSGRHHSVSCDCSGS